MNAKEAVEAVKATYARFSARELENALNQCVAMYNEAARKRDRDGIIAAKLNIELVRAELRRR